jgi:AbrB family looped-hinge helix DNA binding protein
MKKGALKRKARITSKGQITVPHEIRRALGVRPGDSLIFEQDGAAVRVTPVRAESRFEKFRGIGNPGVPSGRKAIIQYIRRMRGR